MLVLGCWLLFLGVAVYLVLGGEIRLIILTVAGVAFLIAGAVYPNRAKGQATQ